MHLAPFDTWCAHRISGVDKKKSGSPRSISISIVDLSLGYQLFYATKEARLFFLNFFSHVGCVFGDSTVHSLMDGAISLAG